MTTDTTASNHNHFTRDIKPQGVCPGCDLYWFRAGVQQQPMVQAGEGAPHGS